MLRERPFAEVVKLAVEQFGSEAHFAEALGVTREELARWKTGAEEPTPEILQAIADLARP
jgi:transcriptional regulator with XRE-family HTH domain